MRWQNSPGLRTPPIRAGALRDAGRADQLEDEADQRYADADETLHLAFRRRLAAEPSAFASAGD